MTEQTIYRHLRELRAHFTPPPGFTHPEISDGTLVMMTSPRPRHQLTAVDIRDQLTAQLPEGLIVALPGQVLRLPRHGHPPLPDPRPP
ncbi:hypothetical protein [Streptomyces longwoodensis]|uniref:hypothetical protein n=1 Tax=Streptomyces longwoodensis TaxID=68231 RepID=UPI0030DDF260